MWGSSWRPDPAGPSRSRVYCQCCCLGSSPPPHGSLCSSRPAPPDPCSAVSVCVSLPHLKALTRRVQWGQGRGRGWVRAPRSWDALQQHQAGGPAAEGHTVSRAALGLTVSRGRWGSGPSVGTVHVAAEPSLRPAPACPGSVTTRLLPVAGRRLAHLLRSQPRVGLLRTGRQVATVPSWWTEPGSQTSSAMGPGTWPV